MSDFVTGQTRGGGSWTPKFVETIDQKQCIGCGRCYKVCGRDVLELIGITEDGDIVDAFDDEAEKKVMSVKEQNNCIGCESCSKVCSKSCITHKPLAA
ncbi:Nif-specific ferredoxin III [Azospirillum fermentarium]|uniref:ferredoxin III, nif-specific n=1 Tax=Azospirillum fermentarium TaxID=1233114 RepID=UPI002227ED55|nr:ferredoxin III, nif-specific [Azospirillum fermentarium]MCW2244418.1 Nif-specific ferredoxin III [Azospirillum fermentarium]